MTCGIALQLDPVGIMLGFVVCGHALAICVFWQVGNLYVKLIHIRRFMAFYMCFMLQKTYEWILQMFSQYLANPPNSANLGVTYLVGMLSQK